LIVKIPNDVLCKMKKKKNVSSTVVHYRSHHKMMQCVVWD